MWFLRLITWDGHEENVRELGGQGGGGRQRGQTRLGSICIVISAYCQVVLLGVDVPQQPCSPPAGA